MDEFTTKGYKDYREYLQDQYAVVSIYVGQYQKLIEQDECDKETKLNEIQQIKQTIKYNVLGSEIFIAANKLKIMYNLSDLDLFCVMLGALKRKRQKLWKLVSELNNNSNEHLTYDAVLKLYYLVKDTSEIENFDVKSKKLKLKLSELGYSKNHVEIPNRLFEIITLNLDKEPIPRCLKTYYYNNNKVDTNKIQEASLFIREEKARKIKDVFSKIQKTSDTIYYYMQGPEGIGKKTLVKRASKLMNRKLIIIDLKTIFDDYGNEWFDKLFEIAYENKNAKTILCVDKLHVLIDQKTKNLKDAFKILNLVQKYFKIVFVLSNEEIEELEFEKNFIWLSDHIFELNDTENLKLWQKHMSEIKDMTTEKPEEIANKFKFTPAQIEGTVRRVRTAYLTGDILKLDKQQFARCAYSQVMSKLGETARLITKKYTWDDIVLDSKTKKVLQKACDRMKYRDKVYNQPGMKNKSLYGAGLSMLFYGSSGTGKTMAAQVISNELGMDLYQVNSAKVISKYVGETEKNLMAIFEEAQKSNVVLLFDEADAIFAKRTEVKDSHDKNANTETSYLLQVLDTYNGVLILTTNFNGNIDEAFTRRFTFMVPFGTPDTIMGKEHETDKLKLKEELWHAYFVNSGLPVDKNIDYRYLTTQFNITGGKMSKIFKTAAFLAMAENSPAIGMVHILEAILDETNYTIVHLEKYENLLKNRK